MMEIYEVLNQVHSEEEYMAALIGGVVLSGGIAYANSEGLLDKFFHNEQTEEVPEQYVER